MGADMTAACAPACDLTANRTKRIKQVIRSIRKDDEDLRDLMESLGYDDAEHAKKCLLQMCQASQREDRQITTLHLPGCPYPVRVAGGLSWGDPPSESYTVLEHVARCPQLWQVLEEFAREDGLAASLDSAGAAATLVKSPNVTVIITSDELGHEHFHYGSLAEALCAIQRLVVASQQ